MLRLRHAVGNRRLSFHAQRRSRTRDGTRSAAKKVVRRVAASRAQAGSAVERRPPVNLKSAHGRNLGRSRQRAPRTILGWLARGRKFSSRRFSACHNHLLTSAGFSGLRSRLLNSLKFNLSLSPKRAARDRRCDRAVHQSGAINGGRRTATISANSAAQAFPVRSSPARRRQFPDGAGSLEESTKHLMPVHQSLAPCLPSAQSAPTAAKLIRSYGQALSHFSEFSD